MLRDKKKLINEHIQTKEIQILVWDAHFENLFRNSNSAPTRNTHVEEFKENAARDAIKKLKNRKTPYIRYGELIKYGDEYLTKELHKLFNLVIEKTSILDEWRTSIQENYIGISLLSTTLKSFTSILKAELYKTIQNREE